MKIEDRHRKAAQKSIQYLHQVTGFLKGESQHLRKLWVESVAQIIADCEASSDPLAVAARMERAEAEVARLRGALLGLVSVIRPLVEIDDNVCYLNGRYAAQVDTLLELAEAALGKDGQ